MLAGEISAPQTSRSGNPTVSLQDTVNFPGRPAEIPCSFAAQSPAARLQTAPRLATSEVAVRASRQFSLKFPEKFPDTGNGAGESGSQSTAPTANIFKATSNGGFFFGKSRAVRATARLCILCMPLERDD